MPILHLPFRSNSHFLSEPPTRCVNTQSSLRRPRSITQPARTPLRTIKKQNERTFSNEPRECSSLPSSTRSLCRKIKIQEVRRRKMIIKNVGAFSCFSCIARGFRGSGSLHALSPATQSQAETTLTGSLNALFPVEVGYLIWLALTRTRGG